MRVNLKGVHQVQRTLATGERVTYCYAWRCGPRLVVTCASATLANSSRAVISQERSGTFGNPVAKVGIAFSPPLKSSAFPIWLWRLSQRAAKALV